MIITHKSIFTGIVVFTTMWSGLAVMQKNRPYGESRTITPVLASTVEKPAKTLSPWHWGFTYDQAQARYTKRLVVARCGTNQTLNLKKGYPFMLENRDTQAHDFNLGGQTYSLPSGGFALALAPASGTLDVTCDGEATGRVAVMK